MEQFILNQPKFIVKSFFYLIGLILIVQFTACGSKKAETPSPTQQVENAPEKNIAVKKTELAFTNKVEFLRDGKSTLSINVALAIKPEERNAGLMGVTKLAPKSGMLFIFEKQEPLSFWMANTPLSLDIIFVDETFKIVRIHSNTEPFTTKQYASGKPARYVVEVNGGFCVENDILEGTEIGFDL